MVSVGEYLRRATVPAAWLLVGISMALIAAAKWFLPRDLLWELLMRGITPWLQGTFLLVVVSVGASAWKARQELRRSRDWILCAVLLAIAGPLAAWYLAPPGHKLYFDEDIYMQIGVSMALDGRAGVLEVAPPDSSSVAGWRGQAWSLNKEPSGYPFFVSLATRIFGVSDTLGGRVNLAFFGLGILGIALWARESSWWRGRPFLAMVPAAVYAVWPENMRWSVCATAEPGAAALATWTLALAARAGRTRHAADRCAACSLAALASQMRPESILVLMPAWLLAAGLPDTWMRGWSVRLAQAAPWVALVSVLVLPHAMHIASVSHEDWGAAGPKFTCAVLGENIQHNTTYWLGQTPPGRNTPRAPAGVLLMFVVGAIAAVFPGGLLRSRRSRDGSLWLAAVLLHGGLLFGIFLPFYAGSYHFGVDVRFSLLVLPVYALLAGRGIDVVSSAITRLGDSSRFVVILALILLPPLPALTQVSVVTEEARQARADHAAVSEFAKLLPADAVVVSHTPSQWALRGVAAVQVMRAWRDPELLESLFFSHPVYYHFNYWDIAGTGHRGMEEAKSVGRRLMDAYGDTPVYSVESGGEWTFQLRRLIPPRREPVIILDTSTHHAAGG